jgi:hypothetical protein
MSEHPSVEDQARAYAEGRLSTLALYEWLAARANPLSDLEAELWGMAIEVDSGDLDEGLARARSAELLGSLPPPHPRFVQPAAPARRRLA